MPFVTLTPTILADFWYLSQQDAMYRSAVLLGAINLSANSALQSNLIVLASSLAMIY
jgi:hypothetical protein